MSGVALLVVVGFAAIAPTSAAPGSVPAIVMPSRRCWPGGRNTPVPAGKPDPGEGRQHRGAGIQKRVVDRLAQTASAAIRLTQEAVVLVDEVLDIGAPRRSPSEKVEKEVSRQLD